MWFFLQSFPRGHIIPQVQSMLGQRRFLQSQVHFVSKDFTLWVNLALSAFLNELKLLIDWYELIVTQS